MMQLAGEVLFDGEKLHGKKNHAQKLKEFNRKCKWCSKIQCIIKPSLWQ